MSLPRALLAAARTRSGRSQLAVNVDVTRVKVIFGALELAAERPESLPTACQG